MPEEERQVVGCKPEDLKDCDLVFSALDSAVAGPIEQACAAAGLAVSPASRLSPPLPARCSPTPRTTATTMTSPS
jgi:hypothetical protein